MKIVRKARGRGNQIHSHSGTDSPPEIGSKFLKKSSAPPSSKGRLRVAWNRKKIANKDMV